MKHSRTSIVVKAAATLMLCLTLSVPAAYAQSTAPDNSQQNQNQTTTAQSQSSRKADRMTTAQARKAVIADKNLSLDAHNVKIVTRNGMVTLKGPVASDAEKQQVATDIESIVSADKVDNQLTVK